MLSRGSRTVPAVGCARLSVVVSHYKTCFWYKEKIPLSLSALGSSLLVMLESWGPWLVELVDSW